MRYFAFLFVLLSSCAMTVPRTKQHLCEPEIIGVMKGSSPILKDATRNAVLYWNSILNKEMFIFVGEIPADLADKPPVSLSATVVREINKADHCKGLFFDWSATYQGDCYVKAKIGVEQECFANQYITESVVRHELGHLYGLDHAVESDLLMSASNPFMSEDDDIYHPKSFLQEELKCLRGLQ